MPKLAKATSPNDGRVAEAVALLVKCPALTLEQVMLAVRFTAADAANRAKQAWIRRRAPLPISMSWKYDQDSSGDCTVDEWENKRYSERRSKSEMRVPQEVRTDWLIDAGYSVTQVRDVVHTIKKEKQEWMSSVNKSNLQDKADDMTEKVKRRLARLGGRRERTDVLYTQWISSQDKQKIESSGEQPNRGHSFKLSRRATA